MSESIANCEARVEGCCEALHTIHRSVGSRCHSAPTMVELGRWSLTHDWQGNPCCTSYPVVFQLLNIILRQGVFWHQNCHF
jgi:hypothetical protein